MYWSETIVGRTNLSQVEQLTKARLGPDAEIQEHNKPHFFSVKKNGATILQAFTLEELRSLVLAQPR
jgi:hypothetical protein